MILLSLLFAAGCGGPKKADDQLKKEAPVINKMIIQTKAGEATSRRVVVPHLWMVELPDLATRELTYHIKWEEAQVNVGDEGINTGTMETVTGEMYEDNQAANTFKADHAKADRAIQLLTLTGHVEIHSKIQHATLTCDKVEWYADEHLLKASGNVKVFGNFGAVGVAEEIWARPELKDFGTPDVFK